ncbi:MAG: SNF2-related protein [Nitrospirota bacterium]
MVACCKFYSPVGVHYFPEPTAPDQTNWLNKSESFGAQAELVAYISQLDEEGFLQIDRDSVLLSWDTIYGLLTLPQHGDSFPLLGLPSIQPITPNLKSSGGLADPGFSIAIANWRYDDGRPIGHYLKITGAIAELEGKESMLPEASWRLVQAVKTFADLPLSEKTAVANRRFWGCIRQRALAAKAGLDNFLARTVVLTPEKLQLRMRKAEVNNTKVIEIIPMFDGVPFGWLRTFDGYDHVQDRYDIPSGLGVVQILIDPAVRTVLAEIKRMPGRRVAGSRAEAFIRNPFSLLGEDATQVILEKEFEEAREEAGIYFYRFTTQVVRDEVGICGASLLIESSLKGGVTEVYRFKSQDELRSFIRELEDKLSRGMECCAWEGWDLELLGDAEDQLRTLRDALAEWLRPRPLIRLSDIYDLSRYSERIKEIGQEKPYYSPYIARQKDDGGWFPDHVTFGFFWTPEGSMEPVGLSLSPKDIDQLEADIARIKAEDKETLSLEGCPKPIGLSEAEDLIAVLREVSADIKRGVFPKSSKVEVSTGRKSRAISSLVVKPNIERVDYSEERRRIALARPPDLAPQLPRALRPDVKLFSHQLRGIAVLQHLWKNTPDFCRGVLLADDMGLGKTLQLLTFVASCLEENPKLDPVLVVAPLSLLENWNAEVERFFKPKALMVETLYGDKLAGKKLRREEIQGELVAAGLTRFLRPQWRGKANIVLTTYETLRDLEFSLASERWSIMICDEAQKIKNANALVTRAAKKQNVGFKIACTGTPVENSLADIWSLFDFIQPGLLGALNEFGVRYRRPIEAKTDEEHARVDELRKLIEPQLIRRTKREVAKDLPRKLIVDSCKGIPMSIHQKTLYSHAINQFKSKSPENGKQKFANHLGLLHYLKRVCTDPRPLGQFAYITESFEDYASKSPKMRWLIDELEKIRILNEKAIIFTEYRDLQRLIQGYVCNRFGITPDIINGDTAASSKSASSRQKRIDAFQAKPGFGVIILSPLAVGVGMNIQAANHVIHYTRTWNPAKEDQATDRAHRIGQDKDVFVYCPTVTDPSFKTFEKRLDELLEWKRTLSEDMLNGSGDLSIGNFGGLDDVEGMPAMEDRAITIEDLIQMDPDTFEVFCAVLWQKQGYPIVYRTRKSGDGGVDVVAIKGKTGALIQAKSSLKEGKELGWEAVKDVVAGEAAYRAKYPDVEFTKYSMTNQFFNKDAQYQAEVNGVNLVNQDQLLEFLERYAVTIFEVEECLPV